jgi:hypothetical protein
MVPKAEREQFLEPWELAAGSTPNSVIQNASAKDQRENASSARGSSSKAQPRKTQNIETHHKRHSGMERDENERLNSPNEGDNGAFQLESHDEPDLHLDELLENKFLACPYTKKNPSRYQFVYNICTERPGLRNPGKLM